MSLAATGRARERILLFSIEGCGKSLAAMDVASRLAEGNRVWVVDNDNAWERMLEGTTISGETVELAEEWYWDETMRGSGGFVSSDRWCVEGGNVVVFHVEGWEANVAAIEQIVKRAVIEDWMMIDTAGVLWANVQEWFTGKVFDSSMEDYFLKVRLQKAEAEKDSKALGAFDGWVDWPVVNATYKGKVAKHLVNPPCNLICVTEQAEVGKDEKDKETLGLYQSFGFKPTGQKRLGHQMQTVIQLRRDRLDDYFATTIKDRGGREKLLNAKITGRGFSEWYLEDVAGWVEMDGDVQVVEQVAPRAKGRTKG